MNGHQVGEPRPAEPPRRFVSREDFAAASSDTPAINLEAFRADQDAVADHWMREDDAGK